MDEFAIGIVAIFLFLTSVVGGAMYCSEQDGIRKLQCIQAVHDKPDAEIKVICG